MDEKIQALNDENVEAVTGGGSDWRGAHWQDTRHKMGTDFVENGRLWYRIKTGDSLGAIALKYKTTPDQLKKNNPLTITNVNQIYAGDTICIRRV